jgi:hypothetical protein
MPIVINEMGTIFSKKREPLGICDLPFARILLAMISSQTNCGLPGYIVSKSSKRTRGFCTGFD